jgi:hypothetical protein
MTAGTVVITGGILATVILLCIIAVLCYCRLQVLPRAGGDRPRVGAPAEGRDQDGGWEGSSQVSEKVWQTALVGSVPMGPSDNTPCSPLSEAPHSTPVSPSPPVF